MCIGCGIPLFSSDDEFDSGTGWPSFYDVVDGAPIDEHSAYSLGTVRTEVVCVRCRSHLGRMFPDGSRPPLLHQLGIGEPGTRLTGGSLRSTLWGTNRRLSVR